MINTYITGIPALDVLLGGGLHAGTVTLVSGASQSGMTTMLDTIVRTNAHDRNIPTVMCDRETSPSARAKRFMAALSGVTLATIQSGDLNAFERQHLNAAADATKDAPLAFSEATSVDGLRWDILRDPRRPRLIAIDGMRFLNRSVDYDEKVFDSLRDLAMTLNAAVVVTHPARHLDISPTPGLGNVPERMASTAEAVVVLRRPEMDGESWRRSEVEAHCVKSRRGRCGAVDMAGLFEFARFVPLTLHEAA